MDNKKDDSSWAAWDECQAGWREIDMKHKRRAGWRKIGDGQYQKLSAINDSEHEYALNVPSSA